MEDFYPSEWREFSQCNRKDIDPMLFFPSEKDEQAIDAAKRICNECVVTEYCLEFALETNQTYGVWGGRDEEERRKLRRQRTKRRKSA